MNVEAVALFALIIACVAMAGVFSLTIWASGANPKTIRAQRARRAFTCPCGHDFVFHSREKRRVCQRGRTPGVSSVCACQGYAGEIPPATLAELLDDQ
jgi:hypothetical protein